MRRRLVRLARRPAALLLALALLHAFATAGWSSVSGSCCCTASPNPVPAASAVGAGNGDCCGGDAESGASRASSCGGCACITCNDLLVASASPEAPSRDSAGRHVGAPPGVPSAPCPAEIDHPPIA